MFFYFKILNSSYIGASHPPAVKFQLEISIGKSNSRWNLCQPQKSSLKLITIECYNFNKSIVKILYDGKLILHNTDYKLYC